MTVITGEDKSIIVRSAEDNDDDVRGRWEVGERGGGGEHVAP